MLQTPAIANNEIISNNEMETFILISKACNQIKN